MLYYSTEIIYLLSFNNNYDFIVRYLKQKNRKLFQYTDGVFLEKEMPNVLLNDD